VALKNKWGLRSTERGTANASLKAKDALRDFVIDMSISRRRQRRRDGGGSRLGEQIARCLMITPIYSQRFSPFTGARSRGATLPWKISCLRDLPAPPPSLPPPLSSRGIQRRQRSRCLRDPGDFRATCPPCPIIVELSTSLDFPLPSFPKKAFPGARLGTRRDRAGNGNQEIEDAWARNRGSPDYDR